MNFNTARENMLLNQVRTWDFVSNKNIDIMRQVQREEFVPVEHRKLAFSDIEIPLPHSEYMMKPILEGRILQALQLTNTETVLEIGTGSGYMTALLGLSSKTVTSIDIHQDFTDGAIRNLDEAKITNCECLCQDLFSYSSSSKFDLIVLTGSVTEIPLFLLDKMNPNGKIFAIIGMDPIMTASLISKDKNNEVVIETLFETMVKPLTNSQPSLEFNL